MAALQTGNTTAGPVYELRFYRIKPECLKAFLETLKRNWSTRTSYSKCIGFWTSEIGGISEAVQIWEYESLSHRAFARRALAEDEKWQKDFMVNFFPQANHLNNVAMFLDPGTTLCTDFQPSASAAYELHTRETTGVLPAGDASETLVGKFIGVYGPTGTEYVLYRYPNADCAYTGALKRRNAENVKGYSRFLVPCAWSPLK